MPGKTTMNPVERVLAHTLETTAETCSDGVSPANVVDGLFQIWRGLKRVAGAITPLDASPNQDASGGHVSSLTEAVMGVTAGLLAVSVSLSDIASAIRERE